MLVAVRLTKKVMVLFEPGQYRRLKERARARGTSVGCLVREAVEKYVLEGDQEPLPVEKDPALGIVALGRSGLTDLASRHDEYLAEIERGQGS